jgi:hypothetical protein
MRSADRNGNRIARDRSGGSRSGDAQLPSANRRVQLRSRPATNDGPIAVAWIVNTTGETMSDDEMKAELERLRSENAALKRRTSSAVRMKVSEKGAVSVYGMGRFPVTLYKEQWLKLLDMSSDIRAFIAENEAQLKAKD